MKTETFNKHTITTDGIVVINQEKEIVAFNEAAQRITGFLENDVSLKSFEILFKNCVQDCHYILNSLKKGESYSNVTLEITTKDKNSIEVHSAITPIKKHNGEIVSVVFIFRDLKEMLSLVQSVKEKSAEILNEKNKLEAIFNSKTEGTFTIDENWVITSFNNAAMKMTGYSQQDALGRKCWEIFQSELCRNGCHMESTMSDKKLSVENELYIQNRNKSKVPIRVSSAPLFDASGNCIGGIETFRDISEIKNLTNHLQERYKFENIIGRSKAMQKIYVMLENVSQTDSTVLITGESGTGKELAARAIHLNSDRKTKPFIVVNCSAFAETLLESELFGHERGAFTGAIRTKPGHFELAHGGTLFLDEIGDISLPVQVKLLRVLETRIFRRVGGTTPINLDIRIIAATNKDLRYEVKKGNFREDLFYRINVFNIHLPPMRERLDDFPLLLHHFLQKLGKKFNKEIECIDPDVLKILQKHNWPGNIREFENVLEHAFVLCHECSIKGTHLPEWLWIEKEIDDQKDVPIKNAEKSVIQDYLKQFNGNRKKTAESLSIDTSTLWRKMKKYNLI